MASAFRPCMSTTGIGSLPFTDGAEAVSFLLGAHLTIPFWPQLPHRGFDEQMIPQYCHGMPCVRMDGERAIVHVDPSAKSSELETFYQRFLEEDPAHFALSLPASAGFHAFERLAGTQKWPVVKGQITGPVTLCTGIHDADNNPLFADQDLRDAAVKVLTRNAQWQIERLKPFASDRVLMFVDEPALAAFGSSAYVYLSEQNVHEMLGEIFTAIHETGAVSGIHVCGNSDWGMVARSGVQVINFDAYQYGNSISLYPEDIRALFNRGGSIAWGIVPTTPVVTTETAEGLTRRLKSCFDALTHKGFAPELLRERAILTPSCGAGSLNPAETARVFELLREVRDRTLA